MSNNAKKMLKLMGIILLGNLSMGMESKQDASNKDNSKVDINDLLNQNTKGQQIKYDSIKNPIIGIDSMSNNHDYTRAYSTQTSSFRSHEVEKK